MPLWTEWWVWMTGALLLGTLEVLVPGYLFLGFAIGAALVGLALLVGLVPGAWIMGAALESGGFAALLVIFGLLSGLSFLLLRRYLGIRKGQVKVWDRDIND